MSDENDLRDEMRRLKEEMQALKQQLQDVATQAPNLEHQRRGIHIDINDRLAGISDYVNDVMAGVAEGIEGEIEKSVLIHAHPRGIIVHRDRHHDRETPEHLGKTDLSKAANIMSALGQEHRLRILAELMTGGKYISDFQTALPEITASTLSSHLDVLQEAGLVVQERVRGRYLITINGRIAYKMAAAVARQGDGPSGEKPHGFDRADRAKDDEDEESEDGDSQNENEE